MTTPMIILVDLGNSRAFLDSECPSCQLCHHNLRMKANKTDSVKQPDVSSLQYRMSDVLCGRGKSLDDHPGNRDFRAKMRNYCNRYVQAGRREKAMILSLLTNDVVRNGVRFLKKNLTGNWVELDVDEMKQKVNHYTYCMLLSSLVSLLLSTIALL